MEEIKEWALNLCLILLITAVIGYLVPRGKVKRITQIAFSLIILSVFCNPLFEKENIENVINTDFEYIDREEINYKNSYDLTVKTATENVLKENSIEFGEISVVSEIEDNVYILKKINIEIIESEQREKARELICETFNVENDTVFTGD